MLLFIFGYGAGSSFCLLFLLIRRGLALEYMKGQTSFLDAHENVLVGELDEIPSLKFYLGNLGVPYLANQLVSLKPPVYYAKLPPLRGLEKVIYRKHCSVRWDHCSLAQQNLPLGREQLFLGRGYRTHCPCQCFAVFDLNSFLSVL